MGSSDTFPPLALGLLRLGAKLAVVVAVVYGIHLVLDWATTQAEAANSQGLMIGVLSVLLLAYALLIAVPFMPGIEIGVSLLMLKGASIAPLVYAATVLGLLLAFAVGRLLPYRWLHGLLADLRLRRACDLVERLEPMSGEERMAHLTERMPNWLRPLFISGRYVTLALLLNLPGSALVGGGGGIAFIAGFSRLFRPLITAFVIALAVLPVPLAVYLGGEVLLR